MRERERAKQEFDELNEQRIAAVKQIRANAIELANGINTNIQRLTDMAPGLNKNAFIQAMRQQTNALLGQMEAL